MASARRSCRNKSDVFCYICGEYTVTPKRKPVTSFITRAYHAYFGIKLADQDKAWAPHMVFKACTETLCGWNNGKRSLDFGIPMVGREPINHVIDYIILWLIVMKFQCLSLDNFLTLVRKMPRVLKDMKTKKWFLKMMLHIHFPKRSWMI